mgnify:CR=1 FL=1
MKTLSLLFLLSSLATAEPVWKQDGKRTLDLSGVDGVLVRFVLDAAPRDPHFETLATADGRNLVWVAPPDHVWHYGLWFSWKAINGVNFWETDKSGRQQGRNEVMDPVIESEPGADTAVIRYRERAFPDPEGPAVLEDVVEIQITRPRGDAGPVVEWKVTTTALADVVLDRTPPPGEPGGRDWGGYGGFSWRGAEDFKEARVLDSKGRRDQAIHRQHASWVNVEGRLGGKPAGLLIVDHPANPRHPASWYVTMIPRQPFWYANPAVLQPAPLKLAKGESIDHRYLVIPHDGGWSSERCDEAAEGFGSSGG